MDIVECEWGDFLMKVSFGISEDSRAIYLTAKDPLEKAVMDEVSSLSGKGINIHLEKDPTSTEPDRYKLEMKISAQPALVRTMGK